MRRHLSLVPPTAPAFLEQLEFRAGEAQAAVAPSRPPREEQSGVRRLPVLELGDGNRRDDCRHYEGCLDRFVAQHVKGKGTGGSSARCPVGCESFGVVPSHARHAIAHEYVRMSKPGPTL